MNCKKKKKRKFKNDKRKISIANCRPHSSQFYILNEIDVRGVFCAIKNKFMKFYAKLIKIFYAKPRENFKQLN